MPFPFAIPLIKALGGAALGAFAKSSNKPKEESTLKNIEPEYFSNFRKSLIGPYGSLLARAGQPMYGNAERASFTNTLNKASGLAEKGLANRIASRTGSLNSGAYVSSLNDIFMNRIGKQADYEAQIPMLNKEAYFKNMGGVLGMGMNWAGRAPIDQNRTSTQSNGSFLSNFAGGVAPMLSSGASGFGAFGNLGRIFGHGGSGNADDGDGMDW